MARQYVNGDIFKTRAQAIAIGINATGRFSTTPLHTEIHDRYPVFVSECRKRGRANLLSPGSVWVWRESTPWIVGLVIRETPQGATRQRYVESALLHVLKNWQQDSLTALALMRLGNDEEWSGLRTLVAHYVEMMELPVIVYDTYTPGLDAEQIAAD